MLSDIWPKSATFTSIMKLLSAFNTYLQKYLVWDLTRIWRMATIFFFFCVVLFVLGAEPILATITGVQKTHLCLPFKFSPCTRVGMSLGLPYFAWLILCFLYLFQLPIVCVFFFKSAVYYSELIKVPLLSYPDSQFVSSCTF